MWRPRVVGDVIASRELLLRRPQRRSSKVSVVFGRPVRAPAPEAGDPWQCPVQIVGLGLQDLTAICGEDSLQSLVLALQFVDTMLPTLAQKAGGEVDWLGEKERPVFASTALQKIAEQAAEGLLSGLKDALTIIDRSAELSPRKRTRAIERLKKLVATGGHRPRRRKTR